VGFAVFAGGCWLVLGWLKRQPGFLYEMVSSTAVPLNPSKMREAARAYCALLMTTALFAVPALAAGIALLRRPLTALLAALAAAAGFAASFRIASLSFPYLPNVVSQYGLYGQDLFLPGKQPVILSATLCRLITAAVFGLLAVLLADWFPAVRGWIAESIRTRRVAFHWDSAAAPAVSIPLLSAAAYLIVLLVRAKDSELYDRYALPLLPLFIIATFAVWRKCGIGSPGPVAWALLVLSGICGVAITHDHFEQARARLRAVKMLEEAKVPRDRTVAGFEDDMWTQVAMAGRLGPRTDSQGRTLPDSHPIWYLKHVPNIKPEYFLATSAVPHLVPSGFAPVQYSTWLPPRRRELLILRPE
jgi:hypothetical protein